MIEIKYVFALITTEELPLADFSGAGQWVMVNHKRRGWELPGGGVHEGESFEEAIIREVFEETEINAYIKKEPEKIGSGLLFLMGVSESFELKKLSSKDPVIDEVRWFSKPPLKLAWGEQELKEILDLFN